MPNYELPNDEVGIITIKTRNPSGKDEPRPAGDTYSVTSNQPGVLKAEMGEDAAKNPAVILTPIAKTAKNIGVTVTNSAGFESEPLIVDILPHVVYLDHAHAVFKSAKPVEPPAPPAPDHTPAPFTPVVPAPHATFTPAPVTPPVTPPTLFEPPVPHPAPNEPFTPIL